MSNKHTCKICGIKFIDERYAKSVFCPDCKKLTKKERNKLTIRKKCEHCGIFFRYPKSKPNRWLCLTCWKIRSIEGYIRNLLDTLDFQREAQAKRRVKYHYKGIKDVMISNQKTLRERLENDNN